MPSRGESKSSVLFSSRCCLFILLSSCFSLAFTRFSFLSSFFSLLPSLFSLLSSLFALRSSLVSLHSSYLSSLSSPLFSRPLSILIPLQSPGENYKYSRTNCSWYCPASAPKTCPPEVAFFLDQCACGTPVSHLRKKYASFSALIRFF